jgi:hypothetical protein
MPIDQAAHIDARILSSYTNGRKDGIRSLHHQEGEEGP